VETGSSVFRDVEEAAHDHLVAFLSEFRLGRRGRVGVLAPVDVLVDGPFNEVLAVSLTRITAPEHHCGSDGGVNANLHVLLRRLRQSLRADKHRPIIHEAMCRRSPPPGRKCSATVVRVIWLQGAALTGAGGGR
jgi:hypothetical protein